MEAHSGNDFRCQIFATNQFMHTTELDRAKVIIRCLQARQERHNILETLYFLAYIFNNVHINAYLLMSFAKSSFEGFFAYDWPYDQRLYSIWFFENVHFFNTVSLENKWI